MGGVMGEGLFRDVQLENGIVWNVCTLPTENWMAGQVAIRHSMVVTEGSWVRGAGGGGGGRRDGGAVEKRPGE